MDQDARPALIARWLDLTRSILPPLAARNAWPIHADHCFMRVFLDNAAGGQWDRTVARPAIRHMPTPMLARAVALAESVLAHPDRLAPLNHASLAWRRAQRRLGARDRPAGAG